MIVPPSALAVPGSVDPTFGTEGIIRTKLGPHYETTSFTSLKTESEGGLLATRDGKIRRYEANGSLDPSFEPQKAPEYQADAVEGDGRDLIVEQVENVGHEATRLKRLNADGTPDIAFGEGGKSEAVPFDIEEIAPLPSGKILVGGREIYQIEDMGFVQIYQVSIARLDPEGKLDPSFGKGGVVELRRADGVEGNSLRGLLPREGEGTVAVVDADYPGQPGSGSLLAGLTASGTLDPNYGTAGVVHLGASIVNSAALNEGKVQVAGTLWGGLPSTPEDDIHEGKFYLARYLAAGQPDQSFGNAGSVTASLGDIDIAHAALWEKDGSVTIGGSTSASSADCLRFYRDCRETPALARFTPDGQLDPSFGTRGVVALGALTAPDAPIWGTGVLALGARPGGGVFAAGGSGNVAFLAAFGQSGALDPGFGNTGIATEQDLAPSSSTAEAVAVDHDGRILVAGGTDAGSTDIGFGAAVFRYLPDGELDRSFGQGTGYVRVPEGAETIAGAPDDSTFALSGGDYQPEVTRITAAGEIDPRFGEEGTALLDPERKLRPTLKSLIALPGGGVMAAGSTRSGHIVVFRLRPDGSPDRAFGRRGVAVLGFGKGRQCGVRQLAIQPYGRILLAGFVYSKPSESWAGVTVALMRLLPNGVPDPSFGHHGRLTPRLGRHGEATAIASQHSKILVAGWDHRSGKTQDLLLRYTENGHLDPSFARHGISRISVRPPGPESRGFEEKAEILPTANRIIVVRDGGGRPVLAYRQNGRFERSFASGDEVAPKRSPSPEGFPGPFGALQHGRVILAWPVLLEPGVTIDLQRLTSHSEVPDNHPLWSGHNRGRD